MQYRSSRLDVYNETAKSSLIFGDWFIFGVNECPIFLGERKRDPIKRQREKGVDMKSHQITHKPNTSQLKKSFGVDASTKDQAILSGSDRENSKFKFCGQPSELRCSNTRE